MVINMANGALNIGYFDLRMKKIAMQTMINAWEASKTDDNNYKEQLDDAYKRIKAVDEKLAYTHQNRGVIN